MQKSHFVALQTGRKEGGEEERRGHQVLPILFSFTSLLTTKKEGGKKKGKAENAMWKSVCQATK